MDVKEKLKAGWVHVLVTFEIVGKPQEYVDKSLKEFLSAIKKEARLHFLEEHVEPAIKTEKDDFFSAFAEVDMLAKDMETLTWLIVNYTPASIEIIEPSSFKFSSLDVQNWLNDVLSNLHAVGMDYKSQISKVIFLQKNLAALIDNTVLMSLGRGKKKLPELAIDTTLTEDALKQHLERLLKDKKIEEKKGVYSLL